MKLHHALVLSALLFAGCQERIAPGQQAPSEQAALLDETSGNLHAVNAVLGDASYLARFGTAPGPEADEDVRIQTHLAYVERLLRARPVDHLSPDLRAARAPSRPPACLLDARHLPSQ